MCEGVNVTGSPFAPLRGWVPKASYMGSGNFELESGNVTVDTWGLSLSVSIKLFVPYFLRFLREFYFRLISWLV